MTTDTLPTIDWMAADFQTDIERAAAAIAPFQEKGGPGFVRSQRGIEVVNYDTAVALTRDPRFSLAMPHKLKIIGITEGAAARSALNFLFSREGVDHVRARKACAPWFTASGAEKLRAQTRQWVGEWLDAAAGKEDDFEFLGEISNRLPSTLFCAIIGAPVSDAPFIQHMSEEMMLLTAPPMPGNAERIEAAAGKTEAYLLGEAEKRRSNPGEDLLSHLVKVQQEGTIDDNDILAVVFNALVGSTDTTSAQICLSLQSLAAHPDQWELLKNDPSLAPKAVMELLRYNPGAWSVQRSPYETLEYEGLEIKPEDTLFPCVFAANNDESVFPDPRRLDITRDQPASPLNFGMGRHGCLGRMITLMEQEEVLVAVTQKWSNLTVLESNFTGQMFALAPHAFRVSFSVAQ
ncbi:cytochrome P450 [Pseudonocardia halophobica]|uniref:cytochrome P450 n=1 Tax=Pseudonocardia halophobica TaxID=29401 RepID=UPI003D92D92C